METSNKLNAHFLRSIFFAGLLSGSLDGLSAIIQSALKGNKYPGKIFQYIASAAVGPQAYAGGSAMVLLGLFFHYLIAFSFAVFLFVLYPTIIKIIKDNRLLGLLYGVFVWIIMNLLVVPNSRIGAKQFTVSSVIISMLIIIVMIGFPITFLARKYYQKLSSER